MLAKRAGLDADRCVQRVTYESLGRAARRPLQGGLKCEKAINALGLTFKPLTESLFPFTKVDPQRTLPTN
jgi:hypothetical protein